MSEVECDGCQEKYHGKDAKGYLQEVGGLGKMLCRSCLEKRLKEMKGMRNALYTKGRQIGRASNLPFEVVMEQIKKSVILVEVGHIPLEEKVLREDEANKVKEEER